MVIILLFIYMDIKLFQISGYLLNTGHDVTFELDDPGYNLINVSYGPLSYLYRIRQIKVHFGNDDMHGSEHTIQGRSFPAEVKPFKF